MLVASVLAALVCVVLRFRAARGVQRQQLRWVAVGALGAVIGIMVGLAGLGVAFLAAVGVPVGVGVAVLRYRLWDLDCGCGLWLTDPRSRSRVTSSRGLSTTNEPSRFSSARS